MADLSGFDLNRVERAAPFEPIPAGKYPAMITASEYKANKAGTGRFLELTFTIVEGEYKNRHLWARLNLDNPNEMATKIARGKLAAVCLAVGVLTPSDSAELHNLPLVIKVRSIKHKDTGQMTNEITAYEKPNGSTGSLHQAQTTTPPRRK